MAATSNTVPLYIAVCLKCKDSQATPDWESFSRWTAYQEEVIHRG